MSGSILKRHAVGESVHLLGTLYDARRDIFLHQSLFESKAPHGAVELTPAQTTASTIKTPTNFQERCDMVEIRPELGASILSGLCDAGGYWERFLVDQAQGPVLRHTITACVEELNLMAKGVKEALCLTRLHANATHVLTGISWGADFAIRAKQPAETPGDKSQLTEYADHGREWVRYDPQDLGARLKGLEPSEQFNIQILGETGVGKSTWINAFVNYVTHDTLDDAFDAEELKWVVPSSFSTQLKDSSDSQGRLVQRDIKIGSNKDERNGAHGQSATQRTCVYTVDIGNTRVRLIDTPGIGDTRGLDQDNKNMLTSSAYCARTTSCTGS